MGFVWSPKNIYFHLNAVSCVFPDWLPDCKMFFSFQIPPDDDDDDDDDGVYLKAVNINLRANLQIIKSVNLKYL